MERILIIVGELLVYPYVFGVLVMATLEGF